MIDSETISWISPYPEIGTDSILFYSPAYLLG